MQNLTLEDLQDDKLCRICLTKSEITRPLFIFNEVAGGVPSEILKNCASVQLQQDNRLPNGVCPQCVELLVKLHGFKKLCDSSNDTLQRILTSNVKVEDVAKLPHESLHIKTEVKDEFEAENCNGTETTEAEFDELDFEENPYPYSMGAKKRKCLTIGEKLGIIDEMERGETNTSVCRKYRLSSSTVSGLWKNKELLRLALEESSSESKRLRKCKLDDLDQALFHWFQSQRNVGGPVNGPTLKVKAEQLANSLGHEGFYCYNGWITRFKRRHNIKFAKERNVI